MDNHRFWENHIGFVGHDSTTAFLYSAYHALNLSNVLTCSGGINIKVSYLINNFVKFLVHEYHVYNKISARIQIDYFG